MTTKTHYTEAGRWDFSPVGFDFSLRSGDGFIPERQDNWANWPSRDKMLDHYREKLWISAEDLELLANHWPKERRVK